MSEVRRFQIQRSRAQKQCRPPSAISEEGELRSDVFALIILEFSYLDDIKFKPHTGYK